jgi:hypothetical protein
VRLSVQSWRAADSTFRIAGVSSPQVSITQHCACQHILHNAHHPLHCSLRVTYFSLINYFVFSSTLSCCMMTLAQLVKILLAFYGLRTIVLFTTAPTLSHPQSTESNRHHTLLHLPFPVFSTATFNTVQITRISEHCFVLYLCLQTKYVLQPYGSVAILYEPFLLSPPLIRRTSGRSLRAS